MQKLLIHSLVVASVGAPASLRAAEQSETFNLPDLLITATRTETPSNELATASTVFTRSDIERLQVRTLPELLKTAPGIDMTQNGGFGQQANLYIRGTGSDHVLVLIDGIKAGSATSGTTSFQFIPIDQIDRVEIIRGPQSSLYGSEAIGGVIQVFTRKETKSDRPRISLETGAGSFDTFNGAGSVSANDGNTWYSLGASHLNSQGINVRTKGEDDRDGYYNTGLNARLGHRMDNGAEIEAFFVRAEGRTEYDGTPNKTEFVNQTVGTSAGFDISDFWRSTLRFGQSLDENDNFLSNGNFYSRFNSTRWNATWLNQITLSQDHQLTVGTDYRVDEVQSTTRYSENSRYDVGVFGELHSRWLDRHFINASVRWDRNQAFGDIVTGNFGWRFNWNDDLSTFASFGNAFKAPSFNDLYWPHSESAFSGTTYISEGNNRLKPEESATFEAGIAGRHDWLQWQLRAYHTDIDNLIDWSGEAVSPAIYRYRPENIDKARIDGLEAEFSTETAGWRHKLNLGLLNARNKESGHQLARRAEQSLSYDLSGPIGPVEAGVHVSASGKRFDDRANTKPVGGFVTADLRTAYRIDEHWTLSAKLNNVLDKRYQTVDTYNTAGRNFFFSIHYLN